MTLACRWGNSFSFLPSFSSFVSFNQFRHGLYSLTVIIYDELLSRLKILFGLDASPSEPTPETVVADDEPINLDDIAF